MTAVLRAVFFYTNLHHNLNLDEPEHYLLSPGQSLTHIAENLEQRGIIRNAFDLRVYARLKGIGHQIRAGEYALSPDMTPLSLLEKLVNGTVIYHQVVFLEGWTAAQAVRALQAHPYIVSTLEADDYQALQRGLGIDEHPEGMFFPDTYNFTRGTGDHEILQRAYRRMQDVLNEEWQRRAVGLPYDTPYDALIMASIVEKETGLDHEREQIAGVFVRRLQSNMRLQTDPSVIYGMGQNFSGGLSRADLRQPTPYNTYTNHGLPPTPIALAGRRSIAASLNPAPGETLYFVARGDGSHQFSATLEEHNAAVRQYQIENRSENYRSQPASQEQPAQ